MLGLLSLLAAFAGSVSAHNDPQPYVNASEAYDAGELGLAPNQTFRSSPATA